VMKFTGGNLKWRRSKICTCNQRNHLEEEASR